MFFLCWVSISFNTVAQSITITSPNGGNVFASCNTTTITWTSTGTSNFYDVHYSIDNGVTWAALATNWGQTSFTWTIPNVQSNQVLVRVRDANNNPIVDISDAVFSINAILIVTSANGGETWQANSNHNITWIWNGGAANVNIDYSMDGGTTWTSVANNINASSQMYTWSLNPLVSPASAFCMIRIYETTGGATGCKMDKSNNVFSITLATSILTVTAPNTAVTLFACASASISWTYQFAPANTAVKIEYSTDGGSSWLLILASTTALSYSWTIPYNISLSCLVKVTSLYNSSIWDVSNVNFAIASPTITVSAPNSNVSWPQYSTQTITWTSSNLSSGSNVNIDLSLDGGANWSSIIANTPNDGSQSWVQSATVPSTTAKIRVSSACTNQILDISDVNFTIPQATITVTAPDITVSWCAGSSNNITWISTYLPTSGAYGNVKIEYSTNHGATWSTYLASTPNDGSQAWTVPSVPSSLCLVRISDPNYSSTFDVSNADFTIPPINSYVTTPNGGSTYVGCTTLTIAWLKCGTTGNTKLEYSLDNGSTWILIATNLTGSTYNWTVPNISSAQCLLRTTDLTTLVSDLSNSVFTIVPSISLTSPNGNESWQVGGPTHNITWITNGTIGTLTLAYSIDNGTSWTTVATGVNASTLSYAWTIPNTPSINCLVRAFETSSGAAGCKVDASNAKFAIEPSIHAITVTSPNTTETWYSGSVHNFAWTYPNYPSNNVKIEYSLDNGSTWATAETSTPNDGTQAWTVPNTPSPNCRVRVSDVANSSVFDISDVTFLIVTPVVVLLTPNGSEDLIGCNTYNITWNKVGTANNVKIEVTFDGTIWTTLSNSTSGNSYTWSIPNNVNSSNCQVRITDIALSYVNDNSNAPFSIFGNSQFTLFSANGGEVWQVNSIKNISWSAPEISGAITLQYSTNNGTSWTNISTTTLASAGTYAWTVPNTVSTTCLVKIFETANACKYDQSASVFTISAQVPVITVTSPNTNVIYAIGSVPTIQWTITNGTIGTIKLEYSINNGSTWTTIVASTNASTGAYGWTIPNTPSVYCLVRASNTSNANMFDVSDVNFSISPAVVVTNPDGGEILNGCTATTLNWNVANCSGTYKIEFSTDNGATWSVIESAYVPVPNVTTGSIAYNWLIVSSIQSANCLIKITDAVTITKFDVSNAPFTVLQPITITQPNFGGVYSAGSVMNITWTEAGVSGLYNVKYSSDGGVTWNVIAYNISISTSSYAWTIPAGLITANLKIRVEDFTATNCKFDNSDVASSIINTPQNVVVTAPNGGEIWPACTIKNITWTSLTASANYKLEYSANGGTTWTQIVTNYPATLTGSYSWTIPNSISLTCLVKVTNVSVPANTDQSNASFSISQGIPLAVCPNISICAGLSANLSATGATTYAWAPATGLSSTVISNPLATPVATTTYTVTGTLGGCTATKTIIVTVNPLPVVSINQNNVSFCSGLTLQANGAQSYSWTPSGGLSNTTIANPVATITGTSVYTVTGTSNGCSATANITVYPNPALNLNASFTNICSGESVSLVANGATSYSWAPAFDLNSTTVSSPVSTPTITRTYTVTGTSNGCSSSSNVTINVTASPNLTVGAGGNICKGSSLNLTAGGASIYLWAPTTGLNSSTVSNPMANPINTTTYTVTGITGNCSSQKKVKVSVVLVPNIVISGQHDICLGTLTQLSASGGGCYTWTPATGLSNPWAFNPFVSPPISTVYTAQSTINGCQGMATFNVNVLSVNAGADLAVCAGDTIMLAATGASSGALISWNNSVVNTVPFVINQTTTFTVIATESAGCQSTDQVVVTVHPKPSVGAGNDTTVCAGHQIILSGSGASTYIWNNGVTNSTPFIAPLGNTTYTVTGTDQYGCKNKDQVLVNVKGLPSINAGQDHEICFGDSITLVASGGNNYVWSNGVSNSVSFIPTSTGSYSVTGTGSNGCMNTDDVLVTVKSLPTIISPGNQHVCIGSSLILNASGNGDSYTWNNSVQNGVAFTPNQTLTYTLTAFDSSTLCSNTAQLTVTILDLPLIIAGIDTVLCEGQMIILSGSGGVSYMWSDSVINNIPFAPVQTNTYTVIGTDSLGCINTDEVVVVVNPLPVIYGGPDQNICPGGSVILSASGGITYSWNNSVQNNIAFTPTQSDIYVVTGSDVHGCINADTVTVDVLENTSSTLYDTALNSYALNGQNYSLSGIYTQTIPNFNGCDSVITLYLTMQYIGIEEYLPDQVKVYPNPFVNEIKLIVDPEYLGEVLLIYGQSGNKIYTGVIVSEQTVIDMRAYSSGMYFLKIGEEGNHYLKIVRD